MKPFIGVGVAWFIATVVGVTIATAAVTSVRSEVTDAPTALGVSASGAMTTVADQLAASANDELDVEQVTTSSLAPAPDPEPPVTTTVATTTTVRVTSAVEPAPHDESAEPPSTSVEQPSSVSQQPTRSTAAAESTSTTTVQADSSPAAPTQTQSTTESAASITTQTGSAYTKEIETDGGVLFVHVKGDEVTYASGYARDNWRFDLLNGGPELVDAQFLRLDNQHSRIRVEVTVIDGTLSIVSGTS